MTVGIMQPYFFPYLGYFQLLSAVDKFVVLDDVNYIVKGYINRNSILLNGEAHRFTIPIEKPSRNKLINETRISSSVEWKEDLLATIRMAYSKAPKYNVVIEMLERVIRFPEYDLTAFLTNALVETRDYLRLPTEILMSSKIGKDNSLKGQDRIIAINKELKADRYINPIGGVELYCYNDFQKEGIELNFIKMGDVSYKQFKSEFAQNLSIIDVLMFNSQEKIVQMLNQYEIIKVNGTITKGTT